MFAAAEVAEVAELAVDDAAGAADVDDAA